MNVNNTALYAFRKFGQLVLRTAYCYVGNYSEAEDITQDVFLALHEKNMSFESDEHMKAWLLRVTINKGKNYVSCWKRRNRVDIESIPEQSAPDNFTVRSELRDAVTSLPPRYSTVLFLYYYEEYTIKEISAILGKNENTVSSLLRRGREKLKLELEEFDYDTQRV